MSAPTKRYHMSEKSAQKILSNAVEKIYSMKPFKFEVTLAGSVEEVPVLHIACDSYVYDTFLDFAQEGAEDVQDM